MPALSSATVDVHANLIMSDQAVRLRALELAVQTRTSSTPDEGTVTTAEAYRKFLAGE